jgi:hypothetical protein
MLGLSLVFIVILLAVFPRPALARVRAKSRTK